MKTIRHLLFLLLASLVLAAPSARAAELNFDDMPEGRYNYLSGSYGEFTFIEWYVLGNLYDLLWNATNAPTPSAPNAALGYPGSLIMRATPFDLQGCLLRQYLYNGVPVSSTSLTIRGYRGDELVAERTVALPTTYTFVNIPMKQVDMVEFIPTGGFDGDNFMIDQITYSTVPAPEIDVQQGTSIASGGSFSFGAVVPASTTDVTFTIANTGNLPLNLTGSPRVAVSGANADQFSIVTQPSATVAAGDTTTFVARFAPTSGGVKNAVLTIENDDSNEAAYTINVSGSVLGAFQNGSFESNGGNETAVAAGWTFSPAHSTVVANAYSDGAYGVAFNSGNQTPDTVLSQAFLTEAGRSYTVRFDGGGGNGAAMGVSVNVVNGGSPSGTTQLIVPGSGSINAGPSHVALTSNTSTIEISDTDDIYVFGVAAPNSRYAQVTFTFTAQSSVSTILFTDRSTATNGVDTFLDNVVITSAAVPDIAVERQGTNIPDGGSYPLVRGIPTGFTIRNTGAATLNLGTFDASGAGSEHFIVDTTNTSTTLAPGASTFFSVTFSPTAAGTFMLPVRIASDDPDENPFTLNVAGTAVAQGLEVRIGGSTVQSGATYDEGSQAVGTTSGTKLINVRNTGDLPLTMSAALISGDTSDFDASAPASIPGGTSMDIVTHFHPTAAGTRTATLRITTNDPAMPTFDVVLTGTGLGPEMDVSLNGTPVADNGFVSFGSVNVGASSTKRFTIANTGTATLTLGAVTVQNGAGVLTVDTSAMASSVQPGGTTTLFVTFAPTSSNGIQAAIHIANDDANENPYDISFSGVGIAPEIVVTESGANLTDSSSTVDFGSATVTKTFTVQNIGNQPLTLSAPTIDGTNAGDFAVDASAMTTAISPFATTTFTVTFTLPAAIGPRTAALHLGNNDPDENPFDIALAASVPAPTNLLVDEAGDVNDGNYSTGHLTLREAITLANLDSAANAVTFAPALDGTAIVLASALPTITQPVTITGRGADKTIIDAQQHGRVFTINDGSSSAIAVVLSDLTVTGGLSAAGQDGGGIFNAENLTVRGCAITGNHAQGPGSNGSPFGGGVFSSGALTMNACEVSGNVSDSVGGGVFIGGTGNVMNTTVSGNSALTAGGLAVAALSGPASATVVNCTIVSNTGSGAPFGAAFGGLFSYGATLTLHNNLVAANLENGAPGDLRVLQGGSLAAATSNLIADPASADGLTHGVDGNILGDGAGHRLQLPSIASALANNGGTTKTHALVPGSPAINAGNSVAVPGLTTDQRGGSFPRFVTKYVDIGAYEYAPVASVVQLPDVTVITMGQIAGKGGFFNGVNSFAQLGTFNAASFAGATVNAGDTVKVRIKATPGKVFRLQPGYDMFVATAGWGSVNPNDGTVAIVFNDVSGGTAPSGFSLSSVGLAANGVKMVGQISAQPSATMTFSSVDLSFTVPSTVTIGTLSFSSVEFYASGSTSTAYLSLVDAPTGNTSPTLTLPTSPVIAEATSASGATVNFNVAASDLEEIVVPATATPASGSVFPLGDTTVNVSATDKGGLTTTGSFTVRVQDTTAPAVGSRSNLTVSATSANGAAVFFNPPSATDAVDGFVNVTCLPASGSAFPIGTTTVTCSATDAHNNTGTSSFTVTVTKLSQTIDFTLAATAVPTETVSLRATASSGLPVSYSIISGPGQISDSSFGPALSFTGAGSVVVTANQAGNASYLAAAEVSRTIEVTAANTSLTLVNDGAFAGSTSVLIDVLGNDTTASGTLALVSVTPPVSGGTAVIEGGRVRFTRVGVAGAPVTFTYTASNGSTSATATVTVKSVSGSAGSYIGLLRRADGTVRGRVTATVTSTGLVTGTVRREGTSFSYKGSLLGSMSGATSTVMLPSPLRLVPGADGPTGQPTLAVSLPDTTGVQMLRGDAERAPYSATNPAPQAGRYTIVANRPTGGSGPAVGAALTCVVNTQGVVTIGGKLGNGVMAAQSGRLLDGGRYPFYVSSGGGALMQNMAGEPVFNRSAVPAVSGALRWTVPNGADARLSGGLAQDYDAHGLIYTPGFNAAAMFSPSAPTALLTLPIPSFRAAPIVTSLNLTGTPYKGVQTVYFPPGVGKVLLSPGSGFFSGTRYASKYEYRTFFGVVQQGSVNAGKGIVLDVTSLQQLTLAP